MLEPTKLRSFTFETVRLNDEGDIIERVEGTANYFEEDLGDGVTLDMVLISGGRFRMGSPSSEEGSQDNERPQHEVEVPPFAIGRYQVTQLQWEAMMENNPSSFKGANRPVDCISWDNAIEFCQKLSDQTGKPYRLPSEAEWEYACRAGTQTPFYFGQTIKIGMANYSGDSRPETINVGDFPPNDYGLFDMYGNVYEWCQDGWHDSYDGAPNDGTAWESGDEDGRVSRGGSWLSSPLCCRSATRLGDPPFVGDNALGFRLALSTSE